MTTPLPKELAMFAASGKQLDDLLEIVRIYGAAEYKRGIENAAKACDRLKSAIDALVAENERLKRLSQGAGTLRRKACIEGFELEVSRCNAQRKVLEQALEALHELNQSDGKDRTAGQLSEVILQAEAAIAAIQEQLA